MKSQDKVEVNGGRLRVPEEVLRESDGRKQTLQKEVQELRALKLSPQFYMQMTPPTTLTMCPSCERVAVPVSSSSSAGDSTHARPHQMGREGRRVPINPWATPTTRGPAVAHRPFDAVLQPRS
ncbi:hypothetical protein I3843_09G187500 [Carya illinoinensis]|nr:hypothetical protein I3760_09G191000 [Carya illinoinensis]KAG7964773.1 hypothetical protein I3843_09G187500 [Carya illinoinensis]